MCKESSVDCLRKLVVKPMVCSSCKTELVVDKYWWFVALFIPIMASASIAGISLNLKLVALPMLFILGFLIVILSPLVENERSS